MDKNKLFAGVLLAASLGIAVKSIRDIRALKQEEEAMIARIKEQVDTATAKPVVVEK